MSKTATVQGLAELRSNLQKLAGDLGPSLAKAAYQGARLIQSSAIKAIKTQSPGELVERNQPGQAPYDHIASKPGDAPNTDTGELIRGLQVEVSPGAVLVGVESSQDEKATALEFGTLDGTLAPRPFLMPALDANRPAIRDLMRDAIRADIEAGNKDTVDKVQKAVKAIRI